MLIALYSCKRHETGPAVWNSGPIESYQVTPINGGAVITYTIPRNDSLLYIMAEYERNGKTFTEKASVYSNSLTIEGFNTEDEVKVKLYKVNRAEQKSAPVEFAFKPLESLVSLAKDSLKMQTAFGGFAASWSNPYATELGVRTMYVDSTNKLVTKDVYYSTAKHDEHTFRGFDAKKTTFAIAFEDKWGNSSDTTYFTTTPFFEVAIKKPYARLVLPYDNSTTLNPTYDISHIWDGIVNTSHNGWLTQNGSSGSSITIDIGQWVKLSRIVIHGYHINSPYTQVNIQKFELWASDTIDYNKFSDKAYWLDEYSVRTGAIHEVPTDAQLPAVTFENTWQYLGFFAITRYDLMNPPDQEAILQLAQNGMEYDMPLDAKPVRYVRLYVREVSDQEPPSVANYFSMGEITFYGDNTVPQHHQ
jgi:hypothetical protein